MTKSTIIRFTFVILVGINLLSCHDNSVKLDIKSGLLYPCNCEQIKSVDLLDSSSQLQTSLWSKAEVGPPFLNVYRPGDKFEILGERVSFKPAPNRTYTIHSTSHGDQGPGILTFRTDDSGSIVYTDRPRCE